MRNSSAYIGLTIVSDNEDGTRRVSAHKGLDYHALDDIKVVIIEDALDEFSEEYDALQRKIDRRMIDLGFIITGAVRPDRPNKPGKP